MGTSIGGAIDWLVAQLPVPVAAALQGALVVDNHPSVNGTPLVVVGHTAPGEGTAAQGEAAFVYVGNQRVEESYSIPCYAEAVLPGPAQKPARDAVLALFDAVVHTVHADPTLGGLLQMGRVAIVSQMHLHQTQDLADAGEAGALRLARISFEVHVKNAYIP